MDKNHAEKGCDAAVGGRQDCGAIVGKDQETCEASGCCWIPSPNPNPSHVPWCFKKAGGPRPSSDKHLYWAQKKAMLLMGLVFTCPGAPMLLQGQELLTFDDFDFPTPPKIDWSLADNNAGMVREVKDMIALRSNSAGYTHGLVGGSGKILGVTTEGTDKLGVIHRWSDGHAKSNDVVVVYNMQDRTYPSFVLNSIPYDGNWTVRFDGDASIYSNIYKNSCGPQRVSVRGGQGTVCVPPMSMLIITRA